MEKETLARCAYHESGRVVFAYLADYWCTSMTMSTFDAGKGDSILNGGNDNAIIQKLLSGGKPMDFENQQLAYEVASKLTVIYCAGTCARVFYENDGSVNEETELDFPGQDTIRIEQLQKFMKLCNPNHADDYVSRIIAGIFERIAKPDTWKSISRLAKEAAENFDTPMTRYTIEDTLMASGMKIRKQSVSSGFGIGLSETPDEPVKEEPVKEKQVVKEPVKQQPVVAGIEDESPLDIVLKNFLRKVRTDWTEDEAAATANQVKVLFAKYDK